MREGDLEAIMLDFLFGAISVTQRSRLLARSHRFHGRTALVSGKPYPKYNIQGSTAEVDFQSHTVVICGREHRHHGVLFVHQTKLESFDLEDLISATTI